MPAKKSVVELKEKPIVRIFLHPQMKEYYKVSGREGLNKGEIRYILCVNNKKRETSQYSSLENTFIKKVNSCEYMKKSSDGNWVLPYNTRQHLDEDLDRLVHAKILVPNKSYKDELYKLNPQLKTYVTRFYESFLPQIYDEKYIKSFERSTIYGLHIKEEEIVAELKNIDRKFGEVYEELLAFKLKLFFKELRTLIEDYSINSPKIIKQCSDPRKKFITCEVLINFFLAKMSEQLLNTLCFIDENIEKKELLKQVMREWKELVGYIEKVVPRVVDSLIKLQGKKPSKSIEELEFLEIEDNVKYLCAMDKLHAGFLLPTFAVVRYCQPSEKPSFEDYLMMSNLERRNQFLEEPLENLFTKFKETADRTIEDIKKRCGD
jgi:hypothetical protein